MSMPRVGLTLSSDVLVLVDRDARRNRGTRSGVVEQWLRRAATTNAEREIEQATAVYYRSLRDGERAEDQTFSKALSAAARRVSYDGPAPTRRRRAAR